MLKKNMVVGFCVALMLLVPSVIAESELKSVESNSQNIEEGKADLIIEKIVFEWSDFFIYSKDVFVIVKNIGEATVTEKISVESLLKYYRFGFIPTHITYHFHGSNHPPSDLAPGESVKIQIGNDLYLMLVGGFKFECEVNPFLGIDESDYDNNYYNAKYFKIFQWWFSI